MTLADPFMLNLASLPSVGMDDRSHIPNQSGVYFVVCAFDQKLLYIGASRGLQTRIRTHHLKADFEAYGPITISWLLLEDDIALLFRYERDLINYWKPLFNDGGPHPMKRGPISKGYVRANMYLDEEMIGWAKDHPEGLSGLLRRLLRQERDRLEAATR